MPRKVSLKDIVKAIDHAISELEAGATESPAGERAERAKKMLKGVRETVEGICVPDFEVPA